MTLEDNTPIEKKSEVGKSSLIKNITEYIKTNKKIPTIFGDILLGTQLGQGGNGLVYSGELGKQEIAVKILVTNDSDKINRFKAEYFNIATLPNNIGIVKMIHYEEVKINELSIPVIIMKKYKSSLKNIKANSDIRELEKLFIFLTNTLKFIHSHKIIHRDIKPENIFVDDDNQYVLGDFGIANYNYELYELKGNTKKGDRLANFDFSAPEQSQKNNTPAITMDIYALGQVCQWFVTSETHKGTNRQKITTYFSNNSEAKIYEDIIDKCLSNNPKDRFQTIDELESYKTNMNKTRVKNYLNYLSNFHDALAKGFPKGLNTISTTSDTKIIDRILNELNEPNFDDLLWWSQGRSNMTTIFKKENNYWIMDCKELEIDKIIVYQELSLYSDLLIIITNPSKSFGIYNRNSDYEEAGFLNNTYFTREEYDNGYAEINREVIKLSDKKYELRIRHMTKEVFIIGTNYHSSILPENDENITNLINTIKNNSFKISDSELMNYINMITTNKHKKVEEYL